MMRRASRFVSFVAVLFIASQVWAQSAKPDNTQPSHNARFYELKAALDQANLGHIGAATEMLRIQAKDYSEASLDLAILLYAWRQQFALDGLDPMPPVDWEMDWLRCSAAIGVGSGARGNPALFLANYYEKDYVGGREISGRKSPRLPGPGRAPDLAACWSAVSEKAAVAQDCLDLEKPLRTERKLPAFVCPPSEPTKASIEKYPTVKLSGSVHRAQPD